MSKFQNVAKHRAIPTRQHLASNPLVRLAFLALGQMLRLEPIMGSEIIYKAPS